MFIGPSILIVTGAVLGWLTGGATGLVVGVFYAGLVVAAIAAGAAVWARQIGRVLEPEDAWEHAPRPPLFGPLCDAVYRRVLDGPGPRE